MGRLDGAASTGQRAVGALAPDAHMVLLSSLAAREPQLSAYAASKRAGEAVIATRRGQGYVFEADSE